MLIEAQPARNLKLETFEELTLPLLQTAVQAWLDATGEEVVVGFSIESDHDIAGTGTASFRAYILYTE